MLSSAIESDAFLPYKKSGFYKMKSLKKRKVLCFCLSLLPQKCALQSSDPTYLKIVTEHVKFYPLFFSFGIISQKSSSWFPSSTVKYISQKCHNLNFSYLHMEPESSLIFKNLSS